MVTFYEVQEPISGMRDKLARSVRQWNDVLLELHTELGNLKDPEGK